MTLSRDETETHFSQSAQERINKILHVYTDDEVWIRKLDKLGLVGNEVNEFGGREYEIDMNEYSLSLRKRRQLTDAQRVKMAQNLPTTTNDQ